MFLDKFYTCQTYERQYTQIHLRNQNFGFLIHKKILQIDLRMTTSKRMKTS